MVHNPSGPACVAANCNAVAKFLKEFNEGNIWPKLPKSLKEPGMNEIGSYTIYIGTYYIVGYRFCSEGHFTFIKTANIQTNSLIYIFSTCAIGLG